MKNILILILSVMLLVSSLTCLKQAHTLNTVSNMIERFSFTNSCIRENGIILTDSVKEKVQIKLTCKTKSGESVKYFPDFESMNRFEAFWYNL